MNEHVRPSAFKITEPDIYYNVEEAAYRADPCPVPSLNQSLAKILLERSPKHAWTAHPKLNPRYEPNESTRFDVGNIAHRMLLGRGKALEIIYADDWRTKAAREAREQAALAGKLGVLENDYELGKLMANAAMRQLGEAGVDMDWLPEAGHAEIVLAWSEGDIWFRTMVDWLTADHRRVWDLKTTSASAAPYKLGMKMADDGWPIQAAMHERALDVLDPENAGRREHLFICLEDREPFALTIARLPESVLHMGRRQLNIAIAIWSDCMRTGNWPAYPAGIVTPEYPGYAESRWMDREVGEFAGLMNRQPERKLVDLSGAC